MTKELETVLKAPTASKKETQNTGPFAFPHGTARENAHFIPVLFWTAYLLSPGYATEGVDYLDFKKSTFQEGFENQNVEKKEGHDVLSLTARSMHELVTGLRLKKPDASWMNDRRNQFLVDYETNEKLSELSDRILTHHRTDTLRYFINVYLFTVSLAMKASTHP